MGERNVVAMDTKELKGKIARMNLNEIYNTSPSDLNSLTDHFSEPLVRLIFKKTIEIAEQKDLLEFLKKSYEIHKDRTTLKCFKNPLFDIHYPEYFDLFEANLGINRIITESGSVAVGSNEYFGLLAETSNQNNQSQIVEQDSVDTAEEGVADTSELESLIDKLQTENENLKQQLHESEKSATLAVEIEEILIELLTPIFNKDSDIARTFINEVRDCDDIEIVNITGRYVNGHKACRNSIYRHLWRLLHAFRIYNSGERNWNTTLKSRINIKKS